MKKILIAGGTGLVGHRLTQILLESGLEVAHLSRRAVAQNGQIPTFLWNVEKQEIDPQAVEWADAVINLAGAGIAEKRWSAARKRELISSRVDSTRLLKTAFLKAEKKPSVYLAASATGFYGHRGEEILTENSTAGRGFLPECTVAWEAAADEISSLGIRTVKLRIGVVFSTKGGALVELMKPARFGISPVFADGEGWNSWIHIDDLCRQFLFFLKNENQSGVFNSVAPNPLKIRELSQNIAVAMNRKWAILMPVPTVFLRLFLGEMADVVLNSTRVSSQKMEATGFGFQFPKVENALADLLKRGV